MNYHPIGWADSAHGFVFVSGLTVGLVYTRRLQQGVGVVAKASLERARKIYAYHVALVAGLALVALFIATAQASVPHILEWYSREPVAFTLASVLMLTGSSHMGILPMYVVFILATPLMLRALAAGHAVSVAMVSAALWLLAQSGLIDLAVAGGETWLAQLGHSIPLGLYFDLAAWQALYVAGLIIGFLAASGRFYDDLLRSQAGETAFKVGVGIFVGLAVYDRIVYDALISPAFSKAAITAADRGSLAPIYVLAFALDLFLVAWLLCSASEARSPGLRQAGRITRAILSHPALTILGRHGLEVFAWHIVVVYAVAITVGPVPPDELPASLLLIAGVVALYLPPLLIERRRMAAADKLRA